MYLKKIILIIILFYILLLNILPIYAEDAKDWLNKGNKLLFVKCNYEEAIKCFDKALEIDSNCIDALVGKGISLSFLNKNEEALKYIDKVLEINSKYDYGYYGKGIVFGLQGWHKEAIQNFDRALTFNPSCTYAYTGKAVSLGLQSRYDEAIKCINKGLEINHNDAYLLNCKGFIFSLQYRNEEAITYYDKVLKIEPEYVKTLCNKGINLIKLGKYKEAIDCCDKAIKINPMYIDAWYNKGVALKILGKNDEAKKCKDKAVEIESKQSKTLSNKENTLEKLETVKSNEEFKIFMMPHLLPTLVINIASLSTDSKYKGYIYLKNGIIYTSLEDLKQHLLFNYEYSNKKIKVHLSSSTIEYSDSIIRDGADIYVPLTTFCEKIGFQLNYNESTNTLNITKQLAASMTSNLWMSYNIVWGYVKNGEGNPVSDKYVYIEDPRTHQTAGASTNYKGVYFILCDPANSGNSTLYIESSKNIYISGLQAIRYDSYGSSISGGSTSPIVFITDYGTKYHLPDCKYLKDSCLARPLSYVISEGYEACEVCYGK